MISVKHKTDKRKLKTRKKSDQVLHKDENPTGYKLFDLIYLVFPLNLKRSWLLPIEAFAKYRLDPILVY